MSHFLLSLFNENILSIKDIGHSEAKVTGCVIKEKRKQYQVFLTVSGPTYEAFI